MKHHLLLVAVVILSALQMTAQPEFFSMEVEISEDNCQWLDPPAGEGDGWQECPLYAGYKLLIRYDFYGMDIYDVATDDDSFSANLYAENCGMAQGYGEVVELRFADGIPFAALADVTCLEEDENGELLETGAYVIIAGLQGYEELSGHVNLDDEEAAWDAARALADELYSEY